MNDHQLVGCSFHFIKALITCCKTLKLLPKETKLMLSLLKVLVHTPEDLQETFFQEIKDLFQSKGSGYGKFLDYFEKTWLKKHKGFLEGLIKA